MEDINKIRKEILESCKIYIDTPKERQGGQSVGIAMTYPTVIENEDLGIKISVNAYRSNVKNREKAIMIMDLALLDLIN